MNGHDHNHEDHGGDHDRPTPARGGSAHAWVPGLVEVEFEGGSDSGVIDKDFVDPSERRKPYARWSSKLVDVLNENQLIAWKPSFPLTYPWSNQKGDAALDFFRNSGRANFVTFRFSKTADVSGIARKLEETPDIRFARPVARVTPPSFDEPYLGGDDQVQGIGNFESQWYAYRCNLPRALEQVKGTNVVVAAIDWGFDCYHPDYSITLKKNIYRNNQAISNGFKVHHGTAVMGLAGARLNKYGMVGFAPDSILWGIQAGENGVLNHEHWRAAIDFVREEPCTLRKVIILEVQTALEGNIEAVLSINQAIRDAILSRVVVCVPAGNGTGNAGFDDQVPPQPIPETGSVLVGATRFDPEYNFVISKDGERIVVYAPGDPAHDLTCSNQPVRFRNGFGGTSGAVAKVAGAVALMLEANNLLTPAEVRDILRLSQIPVHKAEPPHVTPAKVGVLLDCDSAVAYATQGLND